MIGTFDRLKDGAAAEALNDGEQERRVCQGVAIALDEKHRYVDPGEMVGARGGGLVCRVQREANKREAANLW